MAPNPAADQVVLRRPAIEDGPLLWRLARDSGVLDVNSPYAYALWCRDFAATSVIARDGGRACGFATGYARPDAPDTLFVWQVAVDRDHRGLGLARRMLDELVRRPAPRPTRFVEATVTPSNTASAALFASFARDRGCPLTRTPLFAPAHLDGHEPEHLHRLGPLPDRPAAP
ncbi:diaminobutyrate acetyltransferase [Actinomadura parmotrematis]|uniref:L-2,4-diaminobutyric acid acetyltransferase n=1 Tax=Actinomadura parmotrematis TaxID=2864039 RepID=A0ABS7FLM6_9ACTN|nr:diaminobutyrate acetyltransferase [Actinomadura parmotrematis]MBW8481150.1 diaminobutyrate acetyltransferase [Actinomadura parmotrematis]